MNLPPNGPGYYPQSLSRTDGDQRGKAAPQIPYVELRNDFTSGNGVKLPTLPQSQPYTPRPRLLTVDEALQYSPFSSIIPFSPEIIPVPNPLHASSASILESRSIGHAAREQISRIDEELRRHQGNSALALKAFSDLKPLLNGDQLTEYHIKGRRDHEVRSECNGRSAVLDAMSPFARMVFNESNIAYTIENGIAVPTVTQNVQLQKPPLPKRPPSNAPSSNSSLPVHSLPMPTVQGGHIIHNHEASLRNADVPAIGMSPPQTPSKQQPMVLIKPLSDQVPRSEYKTIHEHTYDESNGSYARKPRILNQDQRAAAGEALEKLQYVVSEVVEGEVSSDQMASIRHLGDGQEALSDAGLSKLMPSLQKVASLGRLKDIAVHHLSRIQRLCENAIVHSETISVTIRPECSEDELSRWSLDADEVLLAFRSSRVVLCIMEACHEEKQLHSEELIQKIIRLIEDVTRSCIIPVVECRNADTSSGIFNAAIARRKQLLQLMQQISKTLNSVVALTAKVEIPESVINSIEYFAFQVLFVESASSEKDSVLGGQKFETLRCTAMDNITEIFSRYREQRTAILDEILTSLQKLPTSRQHARQFRLSDGSSIQLVSALIMRLIQTAAAPFKHGLKSAFRSKGHTRSPTKFDRNGHAPREASDGDRGSPAASDDDSEPDEDGPKKPRVKWYLRCLAKKAAPLCAEASTMTSYVVRFFVQRAMNAPKSGDQPHRHLLDIFCEDLLSVVSHPEWPASELLLRVLLMHMVDIAENPKFNAPAKAMALETLGHMGSAISSFVAHTRNLTKTAENTPNNVKGHLAPIFEDYMTSNINPRDLYDKAGVYNMVLDYMQSKSLGDPQYKNACGHYLTFYAKSFAAADVDKEAISLEYLAEINDAFSGSDWVVYNLGDALSVHHQLAYAITALNMDFFRQFDRIMKILLDSIISDQVIVRNKSLKSVTVIVEREPSLLERSNIKAMFMRCATDPSPSVRDSALTVIGKGISLRPSMEQDFRNVILKLSEDVSLNVRKRAMKLLKEMFLRTLDEELKAAISDSIFRRSTDIEKSVSELARQIFDEIWLHPFRSIAERQDRAVSDTIGLITQLGVMTKTIHRGETPTSILTSLLSEALSSRNKDSLANFMTCKVFVATSLDIMLGAESAPHKLEQRDVLPLLMVLAKSRATLFAADQLQYLQPYVSNLANADDLTVFRSAVIIFRTVLPTLPGVQKSLLSEVQASLLQSVAKLKTTELVAEVAACLWTINERLKNPEKLINLTAGVIKKVQEISKLDLTNPAHNPKVALARRYIRLIGSFGQHCDFENYQKTYFNIAPEWRGSTVAGLFVSSILPFVKEEYPLSLRADAYHAISAICQRWPRQFNQSNVSKTIQAVLSSHDQDLQNVVLCGFRDFFLEQERQAEVKLEEQAAAGKEQVNGKLGASMTASDSDEASALIAQKFLEDVSRIALASNDTTALTATEVVTSINRQGLVHPKESAPTLVALETSIKPEIASIAYKAHLRLHQQHESMFEREYARCLSEVFKYQKNVAGDTLGYTTGPLTSKLHSLFEVINTSNGKYQQKFITNLCARIDFDVSQLDVSKNPPSQLEFARFLIENLAFFDYVRTDELQHTIACMERIVARTGSTLSHVVSVELSSFLNVPAEGSATEQDQALPLPIGNSQTDPIRLRQITTGAIILACLWEARTYLRRLYGLNGAQRRASKGKPSAKDLTAAPSKVSGVSGEKLISAIAESFNALESQESMLAQCRALVQLMSVDSEVKVADSGEDEAGEQGTPSGDEGEPPTPASGGSRKLKRKGSESVNGTPYKRRGRPALNGRRKSGKREEDDSDWE